MDRPGIGSIVADLRTARRALAWIDIQPRNGLWTAHPGRLGRRREQARFATSGPLPL